MSIAKTFRSSVTLQAAYAAARRHFAYAALFSALLNMLFIAPMLYMLQVYDRVVPTQGRTTLLFLTLILVVSLATLAALEAIRSRLLVRARTDAGDPLGWHRYSRSLRTSKRPSRWPVLAR